MKKQKNGFINFICSLIPGAGEMNMGFEKQGLSIMIIFWGIVSFALLTEFEWILALLPIVWFYSFFHTHNLKNMTEEAFEKEEDRYLIHVEELFKNKEDFLDKYRKVIAGFLIFIGICIIGNAVADVIWNFIPDFMYQAARAATNLASAGIIGIGVIIFGILMLHKKEEEKMEEEKEE